MRKLISFIFLDTGDLERHKQGISYLLKAAEQGHELALELLGACFRTRRGITTSNENEVRQFLTMTPGERSAKRAAQELFTSLSGGEEFVTVEQLEKRMREIYKLQTKKKRKNDSPQKSNGDVSLKHRDEDDSGSSSKSSSPARIQSSRFRERNNSDHISEANLIESAQNYSNGIIPVVNQALTVSVPHPQSLDHVPYLHRPFFHPTIFFVLLYHRLIRIFSSFPTEIFTKYQIIIALAVYGSVSVENFADFLPTSVYYISLIIMIFSSFKMFKSKHEFIDFRIWSGLFLKYDQQVNADDSESLYLRNNLKPFLWFFIGFGVNLMVNPIISDQWMPHSEITVIAFFLTFMTMFCFMYTSSRGPDIITLFSFGINVLAKYPYEMDSVVNNKWRFLDLKVSLL
jgi:wolfamin